MHLVFFSLDQMVLVSFVCDQLLYIHRHNLQEVLIDVEAQVGPNYEVKCLMKSSIE
jgi:hypothetical protein